MLISPHSEAEFVTITCKGGVSVTVMPVDILPFVSPRAEDWTHSDSEENEECKRHKPITSAVIKMTLINVSITDCVIARDYGWKTGRGGQVIF